MDHHTVRSAYQSLAERLDRFPQGAPPSETLYRIPAVLLNGREDSLAAQLPEHASFQPPGDGGSSEGYRAPAAAETGAGPPAGQVAPPADR